MDKNPEELKNILSILKEVYETHMPFNRLLGIKILYLGFDKVSVRIDMKEEFVGNFTKNILHGGVISSLLDLTSGLAASMGVINQLDTIDQNEIIKRFAKMGTIDLRVDYLTIGKGEYFTATAYNLRAGNKITSVRSELHNNEDVLIAAGTASYIVG